MVNVYCDNGRQRDRNLSDLECFKNGGVVILIDATSCPAPKACMTHLPAFGGTLGERADARYGDSSLGLSFVKGLNELLWRNRAKGLFADERDLFQVDGPVKSNSEPAPPPDIRWPEESVGLRSDEFLLDARLSRTPEMRKAVIVVAIEPQRQELLPGEERWRSVAQLLRHTGETHANHTDSLFEVRVRHQMEINFRPASARPGRPTGLSSCRRSEAASDLIGIGTYRAPGEGPVRNDVTKTDVEHCPSR